MESASNVLERDKCIDCDIFKGNFIKYLISNTYRHGGKIAQKNNNQNINQKNLIYRGL